MRQGPDAGPLHRRQPLSPDAAVSIGVPLDDAALESLEALAVAARLAAPAHAPIQVLSVVDASTSPAPSSRSCSPEASAGVLRVLRG